MFSTKLVLELPGFILEYEIFQIEWFSRFYFTDWTEINGEGLPKDIV